MIGAASALRTWGRRRWLAAAVATLAATVVVAVPTDLIDTPVFGREVPPTWWSWPALLVSAALTGLLVATYVDDPSDLPPRSGEDDGQRSGRTWGGVGSVLTFFAVGCPVCNKLVLLALGTSGALTWFEPVQPVLSLAAVAVLGWALHRRLAGQNSCPVPEPAPS